MKHYKIIKPIVLGFLTHNDSYEAILDEGTLSLMGGDIIFTCVAGNSVVSHTQNHAIEVFLGMGLIEEIV